MSAVPNFDNQSYDSKDIYDSLLTELKKARQQFPSEFPKQIDVLQAVDGNVDVQWEERLREAKEDYNGARIILIPYHLGHSHWIGIVLEFKANEEIKRAEFIDPVKESQFNPSTLQKRFAKVYSNIVLLSRNLQKHDDHKQSATLTVHNLIEATKLVRPRDETSMSTDLPYYQTSHGQTTHISTPMLVQGNHSELYPSKQLSSGECDIPSYKGSLNTSVKVPTSEQPITSYENSFINVVSATTGELTDVDEQKPSENELYEELKKQLKDGLFAYDIQNQNELEQRINDKKEEIQSLASEGKQQSVRKRKHSLSELEELQSLVVRIKDLEPPQHDDSDELLKEELRNGLDEHDLKNTEELKQRIAEKKQAIQLLEKENKYKLAQKRKDSLFELEQLQFLADKIEHTESSNLIIPSPNVMIEQVVIDDPSIEEFSVTDENVKNLYSDFSSMPLCAERSIISLLFHISLKLGHKPIVDDHSFDVPVDVETAILKELECLDNRLKLEEIEFLKAPYSSKEAYANVKNENWKDVSKLMKQMLKEVRPLDISELFRLVEKTNDAADLVKNKEVMLFLGDTGSGKSTAIHFFSGSKMIEQEIAGLDHITPTEIHNHQLLKITTTPFTKSETRYIIPVTVSFKDVGAFTDGSIILCDSPGFKDTHGAEVDIANGLGIVKAIKGCKSVKPIVLNSSKSIGDKCEGVKKLAYVLVGMIPDIHDHIKAFSYIFTKYTQKEGKTIHAYLVDINNKLNDEEKSDISFTVVLKDMLIKTRKDALVLDPINGNPGEILDELAKGTFITHPEEVFRFSITEKSKTVVHEHVRRDQSTILSAIKRSEYEFIKYKLDRLKRLNKLLDQEYIERIYQECVRDVSKHLSDEYQEGTSAITRSIMNQIILNDEDVEQYQTRIKHAKVAEELRKEHLGKDTVHNSAFIQYLNRQIDLTLDSLKEKDIDDPSVKTSLDKIKRLSNSFRDLDCKKYQTIRQLFAHKVELVINTFKNSVLSNDFDTAARDLTKLFDAITILQGHLESADLEVKYIELKNYFVKYLNDSADKLNPMFNQEKLDKNDIDSLNSCVCMLKLADQTFVLQPHISKEVITKTYDGLIFKILNSVEEIIKKINTELKNENAFYILEKYMIELDSIRTISIIELKTTPIYCSTLEKLIAYVHETRRVIEEQLRILFRREGIVNYDILIKCHSSLKSAKWIEKYRSEVYSDVVNNVEQQLIQHIKLLQESVMEANLDLDNFDKIELTYKLVSEINEMKSIEKLVNGISECINEVTSWFMSVTNDVFTIIKNTFNIEKWKEQGYQTLDFIKIEKAFSYLGACKKIRLLFKSDCMSVSNSLEEFIRYYSNFIQNEMGNCFESIKQFKSENKEEVFEKARLLARRLRELSEIKLTYSRVFSCFSNKTVMEEWQNELSNYVIELAEEMKKFSFFRRTESLSTSLIIAKALSKLDIFLVNEKYINIYNTYQDKFLLQTSDINKRVIDAIKNTDYEQVAIEMTALQSLTDVGEHFFQQTKRLLTVGLDNLMEETKSQAIMLGNNIEKEEIKLIIDNLKRLQNAKQFVSDYLAKPEAIEKCIEEVKNLIEERIKRFLEGVKALITINNFYQADKKIDSITVVRTLLGNYCTEDVSKQIEELRKSQSDVVLIDVVQKYSEMDIKAYTLNPPTDIFAKFGEMNNTNPIYHQALNDIKKAIVDKMREVLRNAKLARPPNPENIYIRNFESAVKHLPDTMRNALELELKHCKDDIDRLIRDNETNLDKAFKSGDLKEIKSVLEEYKNTPDMQCYVNKGRDIVLKQTQEIASKISHCFEKNNIVQALEEVKKLYDYKVKLDSIVVEIREICSEVRSRIKTAFQEALNYFMGRFLNSNISVITNEVINEVEKSFICLIEFMKFEYEHRGQSIVMNMLPENFKENTAIIIKRIPEYFNEHQKKYKDALDELDVTSLKESLDRTRQWNSLFTKMKAYDSMHSTNDPSMNTIVKAVTEVILYLQMQEVVADKIQELRNELVSQELINKDTKEYEKQRNEFYKKLNEKFSILNKAKIFDNYNININVNKLEQECLESLKKKITDICSFLDIFVEKFLSDCNSIEPDYKKFTLYYNNLVSFEEEMKVKDFEICKRIEQIEEIFFKKIHSWENVIQSGTTIDNIASSLINIKRASRDIVPLRKRIDERIDKAINHYKSIRKETGDIGKLGTILNLDKTGIGQSIISEHKAFEGYARSIFNEKTQRHGIDYVLDNLRGDLIDKDQLKKRYNEFHDLYENLIEENLKTKLELQKLISNIKIIAGNIKQTSDIFDWDADIRTKIPKLAAHIFALWTLQNATHYFEAEGIGNRDAYLLQPHAAQIISIFRMLGIGDKQEELKNNLVQIRTGEGKSVTLGVTACILALLGFDVCCTCYSKYLSLRDYTSFLVLFDSLGLVQYIHYGTFNQLCEDVINENGVVRETIEQLVSSDLNVAIKNSQQIKRSKILLIDEVDVFFSKDFYGNIYTPAASLRDPTITSLVNFIWTHRKSELNLSKVKSSPEYMACCNRFSNWVSLIQEAIKDMLFDINNFESHDYIVKQDKIGYKEQDNIVYKVVYGYKTLFAYYCEYEKGNIKKNILEENISIKIKCGSFSYAEIPLEFRFIIGVTGTLETLSDPEKGIVKDVYKIGKNTYTPSVFGKNNLTFTEKHDIKIENRDDYFNVMRKEIDDRLVGKSSEKRAVLVFFESKQKLKEFYESKALEPIKESVAYLTEELLKEEKESLIKRATTSGQITLFTRTFGRGTDFICHDQNVLASGGAHIIQTFLSEEVSEEVQIKGRTARQGDNGSYSMILLENDLEKFLIQKDNIEDVKKGKGILVRIADKLTANKTYDTVYDLLNYKRTDLFKTQYAADTKYVELAKERHVVAKKFLTSLAAGDMKSVTTFLIAENKGVVEVPSSRTVCLMDATGSMNLLLHKCKNTVDIMFQRASGILKDHDIKADSFQIQFIVYRNYNSTEDKILQSSPWEIKPDNLRAYMNTIKVEGGWGNEAIEIGLWHANKENERENITQVILIGDAPPNTKVEVEKKRAELGENYWQQTKFAQSTYYEDELAKLISNNIPVHAFYVEQSAEATFRAIATKTKGRCEMLDINSSLGSKMLTDLVTEEILRSIGGTTRGNALVDAYRKKFCKIYQ
ncbi:unnamed protein product [Adineta steineri]|uniref:SecA family profile domain-containing protein n=1 Tax=Adineta steineri TaxID=433720 RepID=A0A813P2K8_9BILA|nr:unnamed protein product [Adineta steineri]CAF0761862.1 unnamed protein product [Adineta steineri]CAF3524701.1 unnamed protein product [Adineta steineri]CAF3647523.1 unnamed protein product [Adineta steineri]